LAGRLGLQGVLKEERPRLRPRRPARARFEGECGDVGRCASEVDDASLPFRLVLAAIERSTGGRSLAANLALLEANARLAAEIAVEIGRIEQEPEPGITNWGRSDVP
jgi:hypothetical protein